MARNVQTPLEPRTPSGLLYESFKSVYGWPLTIIAFVASLALPAFLPETEVKVRFLFLPIGLLVILLITVVDFAVRAYRYYRAKANETARLEDALKEAQVVPLPRVVRALRRDEHSSERSQLLLKSHPFFGVDSYVSIFFMGSDEFEVLVGLGVVANIQSNGLIQVEILSWMDNKADVLISVLQNDRDALQKIVVKPSASRQFLSLGLPQGYSPLLSSN